MKIDIKKEVVLIILTISPIIYILYVYNVLPEQVAIHYNFEGVADRFASKKYFAILIAVMTIFTYVLMLVLPKIDPKNNIEAMGKKFYHIKFITIGLITAVSFFLVYKTIYVATNIQFMMVILGGFLVAIGNYFQTIKQNYFLGIKTPWTLNSENNWRETHKLTGKIWLIGGIGIIVTYFIFPSQISTILHLVLIAIMVLIPVGYSFYYYTQEEKILK